MNTSEEKTDLLLEGLTINPIDVNEANKNLHSINSLISSFQNKITTIQHAVGFSIDIPEPFIRIKAPATILFRNKAAASLTELIFNGKRISADDFWKEISTQPQSRAVVALVTNEGRLYSFNVYPNTAGGFTDITGRIYNQDNGHASDESATQRFTNTFVTDLLENLNDAILIEDTKQQLLLANNRICKLFSYRKKAESLVGTPCWKLTKNALHLFKDPAHFLQATKKLIRNRKHSVNEIIELKDGRIFNRDFIPLKNHNGDYMGNMWVYNDITVAYASKIEFENQRKFFENIVNNLPVDIAVFGTDQRYKFLSAGIVKDDELRKWIIGKTDSEYYRLLNKNLHIAQNRHERFEEVLKTKK